MSHWIKGWKAPVISAAVGAPIQRVEESVFQTIARKADFPESDRDLA